MKKTVIIISIVLVILLGAGEIYVQSDSFAGKIRPLVLGPLKELLGADAEIGRVKANLIPPSLEVRDISIRDASGKEAVGIRKIKAYLNPMPLFLKKIRLPSISILEPRIYAVRSKDGTMNLTPLLERLRTNAVRRESEGASGFSLLLRNLSLSKCRIEYRDEATSVQILISDLTMKVRVYLSQERVAATIRSPHIQVFTSAYPEIAGKFNAEMEYDRGRVHMSVLELSTADATVTVSGDAGLLPESLLDFKIKARSGPKVISRFFDVLKPEGKQRASRFEVMAQVKGKISDPVIEGNMKVSVLPFKQYLLQEGSLSFTYRDNDCNVSGMKWKVTKNGANMVIDSINAVLHYSAGGMDIARLDILAGDLAIHGYGRADPERGFDVHLNSSSSYEGKTIAFLTGLSVEGAVNVNGHLSGPLVSPRFNGNLSAGPVTVRGIHFHDVAGGLEYDAKKLRLSSVDIAELSSHYVFDGSVDVSGKEPVYSARLQALKSDVVNIVALFYKQLPLVLSASGELTFQGTAREYSGNGFLKLDAGSAYGETFTRGAITAKLSTGKITFPQVVLYKERGMAKATGWITYADGTYSADLESTGIDLSAVDHLKGMMMGGQFDLAVHSSGSFASPSAEASLDLDALSYRQASLGGMNAEAEIKNGLFTMSAAMAGDSGGLSVRWSLLKPYSWTAEASVKSDEIDPFFLFGNNDLSGTVKVIANGTMTAHGMGMDTSSISGEAVFQKLGIVMGDYRIENEKDAKLVTNGGRLLITAMNLVGPGTRITIAGWVRPMVDMNILLNGTADLSLLKLLYREVEHATGLAEMRLTVRDEWKNPDMNGELLLRNGEIKIKDIPQRFTALKSKIVFSKDRIVADSLSGEVGGGVLNASGWAQLSGTALQEFSVKASIDNVAVRYPEGLSSTLSGELYYDGDVSEQSLSGDITIKRARYDKRVEWKSMMVDIGRGLYQKKKTDVGWIGDTFINVRFHGSDDILFQNNLAKMPLDVDIFLRGTVNHPQLLGRIEARRGAFYFRKNEFKVLHASTDFVDTSRMNPVLDIQAETQVREYLIRLSITGNADHAMVTFLSEPSLNDTDILSLLALGKKGSELKGKEAGVGVGEAASFATGQFQDIFERRARSLTGLDRFQVDPYISKSDTSVPRVTVGKEIVQNRLYVTYSSNVGASAPEQAFRIEYLLNRHFSILGEQNDIGNSGADIKYRFEFN